MGCLVTGELLQKQDFITGIALEQSDAGIKKTTVTWSCRLNILGYFPVVSLITGIGRALLGIIHTIGHLFQAIFADNSETAQDGLTDRERHLQQASLGAKNIGRGLIEAIPVVGNLSMLIFDKVRINQHEKLVNETVDKAQYGFYVGQAYLFPYVKPIEFIESSIDLFKKEESKSFAF